MKQLTLIPEPTKQEMIAEMLELWIAYKRLNIRHDDYDEIRTAHRRYTHLMWKIKDKYGLPYHELHSLLRGAERRENEQGR